MQPREPSRRYRSRNDHFQTKAFFSPGAYYQFKAVIDGKVITDYPERLLLQGKYTKVPLLTGYDVLILFWGTMTEMRSPRHIANETLATNGPAGDVYAALHEFIPLATNNSIQDWINTYASEVWSSQDEKVRSITGDPSARCSVSTTAYPFSLLRFNQIYPDHPC